tara:strand:+ start:548 stop:1228 length:681 start_codon:yes stop_codon:yes gene_type:complete
MDGRDCDFWGILQVKKVGGYYPSFCLGFRRPVLRWPGFVDFFMSVGSFCEKEGFCQKYEAGLTRMLEEQGFRGDCLLNQFEDLCHSSAASLADDVVAAGMPFIRVMMARRNPGGVAHLGEKLAKVCDQSGYPLSVIENHLERTSPGYRKYWNCRIADQTYHCLWSDQGADETQYQKRQIAPESLVIGHSVALIVSAYAMLLGRLDVSQVMDRVEDKIASGVGGILR